MFRIILHCDKLLGCLRNVSWLVWRLSSERCGVFPALSVANQRTIFTTSFLQGMCLCLSTGSAQWARSWGHWQHTCQSLQPWGLQTLIGRVCRPTLSDLSQRIKSAGKLKGSENWAHLWMFCGCRLSPGDEGEEPVSQEDFTQLWHLIYL